MIVRPSTSAERQIVEVSLSSRWDRYFYGPVAAVRPYLLIKVALTLLAFDASIAMLPFAAFYGTVDFNVAHFAWLTHLQPGFTPAYHLFFLLLVGWLALFMVVSDIPRWLMAVQAVLYTYVWSMSRMDSYTHHYLLSILLVVFVFFPDSARGRGEKELRPGARTSAWAYSLLMACVGIIFFYCAMAKVDWPWRSGATLLQMKSPEILYGPVQRLFTMIGISRGLFWAIIAHTVILWELFLAGAYAASARQDAVTIRGFRAWMWLGWILAMALHVGNEFLQLEIRWFSYYMMMLGCIAFLPERVLEVVALPYRILDRWQTNGWDRFQGYRPGVCYAVALSGLVLTVLWGVGKLDLPGAIPVGGVLLVLSLGMVAFRGVYQGQVPGLRIAGAVVIATGLWQWIIVLGGSRGDFYRHLGDEHLLIRDPQSALAAYENAARNGGSDKKVQAVLANNRGTALDQIHDWDQSRQWYERAMALDPQYQAPRTNLAQWWLRHARAQRDAHDLPGANGAYRRAMELEPRLITARYELANLLLRQGTVESAIAEYRACLDLVPKSADIRTNLGAALLSAKRPDEAIRAWRQALVDQPGYSLAALNLGQVLSQQGDVAGAALVYESALAISPREGMIRGKLATLLLSQGRLQESLEQFQQAVVDLPDDAPLRCNYGIALAQGGQRDQAVRQLEYAVKLDPTDEVSRKNLRILSSP